MASSRQAKPTGRKVKTGVVKAERKRKVVKKASAVKASASARKEPYPVSRTRK